jgi:hypothetical protein
MLGGDKIFTHPRSCQLLVFCSFLMGYKLRLHYFVASRRAVKEKDSADVCADILLR